MSNIIGVTQSDTHCTQTISIIPASKVAFAACLAGAGEDIIIFATGTTDCLWCRRRKCGRRWRWHCSSRCTFPRRGRRRTCSRTLTHTRTEGSEFLGLNIGFPSRPSRRLEPQSVVASIIGTTHRHDKSGFLYRLFKLQIDPFLDMYLVKSVSAFPLSVRCCGVTLASLSAGIQ